MTGYLHSTCREQLTLIGQALFRPVKRPGGRIETPPTSDSAYRNVLMPDAKALRICVEDFGPHSLRTTAAANALERSVLLSARVE